MKKFIFNKCVICDKDILPDNTQIIFATRDRGLQSACISHEHSKELGEYIDKNGGHISTEEFMRKCQDNEYVECPNCHTYYRKSLFIRECLVCQENLDEQIRV